MKKPAPLAAAPEAIGVSGDRLDLMQTFVRIVEAGSLSRAAAQMQTTQPTISRRLLALERLLGVRLLQRSTRAMHLTPDGERCYERAKLLMEDWEALTADAHGEQQAPRGQLRVVVPHAFGQEQLVRPLTRFLQAHPDIQVEWLLRDDVHNFIGAGIDCAIQVGEVRDPSVVAIRLMDVPRIVIAAPALLESGEPVKAYDLIARFGEDGQPAKPPTVYRALDFLIENGLIHRIEDGEVGAALGRRVRRARLRSRGAADPRRARRD